MTKTKHGGQRQGAGRPTGSKTPQRKAKQIRFSEAEIKCIQAAADLRGVSFSKYVRESALEIEGTEGGFCCFLRGLY